MRARRVVICEVVAVVALAVAAVLLTAWLRTEQRREAAAWTAITANQTALISSTATGQDVRQLLDQCRAAVAAYDNAAWWLNDSSLKADQECQP